MHLNNGGPDATRTRYLLGANEVLSQVSYRPILRVRLFELAYPSTLSPEPILVDKVGVEPTSRGGFMPAFHNATYPYKFGGEGWIRTSESSQVTCAPKLD